MGSALFYIVFGVIGAAVGFAIAFPRRQEDASAACGLAALFAIVFALFAQLLLFLVLFAVAGAVLFLLVVYVLPAAVEGFQQTWRDRQAQLAQRPSQQAQPQAIESLRRQIATIEQELEDVRNSSLPREQMKVLVGKYEGDRDILQGILDSLTPGERLP